MCCNNVLVFFQIGISSGDCFHSFVFGNYGKKHCQRSHCIGKVCHHEIALQIATSNYFSARFYNCIIVCNVLNWID